MWWFIHSKGSLSIMVLFLGKVFFILCKESKRRGIEMSLWNSTLLIKDNWNAYFWKFGIIYFNIKPFHCSFLFFLFNIPWPDQILDTTFRSCQTELSSLSLWVCVCLCVCMCVCVFDFLMSLQIDISPCT